MPGYTSSQVALLSEQRKYPRRTWTTLCNQLPFDGVRYVVLRFWRKQVSMEHRVCVCIVYPLCLIVSQTAMCGDVCSQPGGLSRQPTSAAVLPQMKIIVCEPKQAPCSQNQLRVLMASVERISD